MTKTSCPRMSKPDFEKSVKEIEDRRQTEMLRGTYESLIKRENEHLKNCNTPGCPECEDARIMMRHYRQKLKELPKIPPRPRPKRR